MRALVLSSLLLTPGLRSQTPAKTTTVDTHAVQASLQRALVGHWTGVLIYRDYSEPAGSMKRVELPTWLTILAQPDGLRFAYVYDDGPSKVVTETNTVALNLQAKTYTVLTTGKAPEQYTVAGANELTDGRGTLNLSGTGQDNRKPAELRTTLTIRRNLLSWLEEERPAGTSEPFQFRHRYVFTRAETPVSTGSLPR